MGTASDNFMREVAERNREKRAKQEERIRKYCDGTRTLQEIGALLGMRPETVRATAKRLGLDFKRKGPNGS